MLSKTKQSILIIGLGQIGGSLGYDLTGGKQYSKVIGYDISADTCKYAFEHNVVDQIAGTIEEGIKATDIIILATPICVTSSLLPNICSMAGNNKIIMDVSTTKTEIFETLAGLKCHPNYFSCHPLAGTEKEGIENARKELFENADFLIIPAKTSKPKSRQPVLDLARAIKSNPVFIGAEEHDRNIALTINLPYAIAVSLCSLAQKLQESNPEIYRSLGGSYRSATRVARSSQILTNDMFLTNRDNIKKIIDAFIAELQFLKSLIVDKNEIELAKIVNAAKLYSDRAANE